ncbi:DAK2 domain-containing protein [Anaerorhabdus sp.]|uniref:DAK2 domain-containing protein n=1 Tax=Anaerorhabdus sp. TaxID=1872524 RepID=UPI002B1F3D5D|nr:DAK2 domain-containing protein [Anaerorhabdus sp.]MEA4874018.1 DAK2 domain-containing protein [Anaerorhabdus sp.]
MNTINGKTLKDMLQSGACNLNNHHTEIDALNVFPVPDGDTGTNMSMTFTNGVKEVMQSNHEELSAVAKTLSKGLLMGARGNSGVILSQIFRGFYQGVDTKEEVNASELAEAFMNGSRVAYKAVMRPVEGTILTVIRESSEMAQIYVSEHETCTPLEYMGVLCEEARKSLDTTPELLPVLKEVGVVDSGGAGLLLVLEGFKAALEGNPIEASEEITTTQSAALDLENEGFGYCTEFIVRLNNESLKTFKEEKLRNSLAQLGESIVVVQDEEIVKVHVHTLTPGDALNLAQRYGEFVKLKIENMQEQHNTITQEAGKTESPAKKSEPKKYAIISVAAGDGLKALFEEYRVDKVISGGQTMNPSTEDFVAAIKELNAEHIFILPNNSNIILAAQQAKDVLENDNIHVLSTKSIPQGLSACIMFNPEVEVEDNLEEMNAAIAHVKTGQVTYAIKDTTFEGLAINEGDYMGIFEKDIVVATHDKLEATFRLLDKMVDGESEIITLLVGEDATDEDVSQVEDYIASTFDVEVDTQKGNQPVYNFIIGVE